MNNNTDIQDLLNNLEELKRITAEHAAITEKMTSDHEKWQKKFFSRIFKNSIDR